MEGSLTSCTPRAHGSVTGVLDVATDVPYSGVEQSFAVEVLAVQVFDAPETAGGDGAFLGIGREVLGGAVGVEAEVGAGGEGAEEASYEVGHCGSHDDGEN